MQLLYVKVKNQDRFAGEFLPAFNNSLIQDGNELGFLVGKAAMSPADDAFGSVASCVEEDAKGFNTVLVVGFANMDAFCQWRDLAANQEIAAIRFETTEGPCVAGPCFNPVAEAAAARTLVDDTLPGEAVVPEDPADPAVPTNQGGCLNYCVGGEAQTEILVNK